MNSTIRSLLHLGAYPERHKARPFADKSLWTCERAPDSLFEQDLLNELSRTLPEWAGERQFDCCCVLHLLEYLHPTLVQEAISKIMALVKQSGVMILLTYDAKLAGKLLESDKRDSHLARALDGKFINPFQLIYGSHRIGYDLPEPIRWWSWSTENLRQFSAQAGVPYIYTATKPPYSLILGFHVKPEQNELAYWEQIVTTMIHEAGIFTVSPATVE